MKLMVSLLQRHFSYSPLLKVEASPSLPACSHQLQIPTKLSPLCQATLSDTSIRFPLQPLRYGNIRIPNHVFAEKSCFALLASCTDAVSLHKIHGQLVVHGLVNHLPCQTKLLSLYGSFGDIKIARMVFDRIQNPDLYSWKVMIRWYFLRDSYLQTISFYRFMRHSIREQDNVVFSIVLKACTELLDLDEGKKLHCQIIRVGNPDSFVVTGLIDMYAKCGLIECSCRLFDEAPERNIVSWTSMIAAHIHNDCPEEGLALFNQMRWELTEPNEFTMGSLLTACSKLEDLHQGKWIHGYMLKDRMEMNSIVVTALLDMYVKCGTVTDARRVFDEQNIVDLVLWTAMVVGYTHRGCSKEALKLFADNKWSGIVPNSVTIASALSASAQQHGSNIGRSIHMLGIKLGLEDEVVVSNALVGMYAKFFMLKDANYVFEKSSMKDVVAWNAMISGYSQNGLAYEALLMFQRMRSEGCLPDAVSMVSVLSACASLGALWVGCPLHSYALKGGFMCNIYVGTALLNFYAKCGDAESARIIFDGMNDKNEVTWCAMMGGYGIQGDSSGSLSIFDKMLEENVKPNDVAFTSILAACSHTGMLGEGLKYFDSMGCLSMVPSMKHYTCMVDLLARAGRIEEALEFIEKMPVQAEVGVWGALLHGCRLHSRSDLGEVVARKMELQPQNASYYVLLSNLYASDGRWTEASRIRKLMRERGLNKSPGCSSMEMDNALSDAAASME